MPSITDRQTRELSTALLEHARRLDPAWTVGDESDPGVTLLAVFAFLAESLLHRGTPIPERARAAARRLEEAARRISCPPSSSAPCALQRVNYVTGVVLGVEDFTDEQEYFRERLRRHALALHGIGVVSGLEVSVEADDGSQGARVVVSPGVALDPTGEMLEVCSEVIHLLPPRGSPLLVQLRFAERPIRPVPVPDRPDGAGQASTRIEEGFALVLDPSPADGAVAIGRVVAGARGWRVDGRFRPKRARA